MEKITELEDREKNLTKMGRVVVPENEDFNTYDNLYLMMTHNCNFACTYCFNHDNGNTFLPIEIAEKTIDLYVKHSKKDELGLIFFGGEPLLAIDTIIKIKEYCKEKYPEKKWYYSITTNLSIINDVVKKYILDDPDFSVMVSLDGPDYINKNRIWKNGKETFNDVFNNLKSIYEDPNYAWKIEKQHITVRATLSKYNIDKIFDIVYFLYKNYKFNWVLNNVDEEDWSDINYEVFKEQFDQILDLAANISTDKNKGEEGAKLLRCIKFFSDIALSFRTHIMELPNSQPKSCGQCFNQFAVDYTGNFSPCHRFTNIALNGVKDYIVGNYKDGFDYTNIRRIRDLDSIKENQCAEKSCKKIGTCSFGCMASGVELNNYLPRCNGNVLNNLFELSYRYIDEIYYKTDMIVPFNRFINITLFQKHEMELKRLRKDNDRINSILNSLLLILEEMNACNKD